MIDHVKGIYPAVVASAPVEINNRKRKRASYVNGRNRSGNSRDNAIACTCGADAEFKRLNKKGPPWAKHTMTCERQIEFARRKKMRRDIIAAAKTGATQSTIKFDAH